MSVMKDLSARLALMTLTGYIGGRDQQDRFNG